MQDFPIADFLEPGDGRRIAYRTTAGTTPTTVFLGGYRSDMRGTKAEALDAMAARDGRGFLRFDYTGHGESSGRFEDHTISDWLADARDVVAARTDGPLVLVGSSMGAWIALLLARELAGRIAGMVLLAPAPDFTKRLVEPSLTAAECRDLATQGYMTRPSEYGPEGIIYTKRLLDDGLARCLMDGPIETYCPVHIIQGMQDADVPYAHALDLVSHLPGEGITLTLVADGDHRLSRPQDLARMERAVTDMLRDAEARTGTS